MTAQTTSLDTLRRGFTGDLITEADPGYEAARSIFNAMIERQPAVIAQCRTIGDVQHSIRFARDRDLPLSIRGGGHSVAGNALAEGGLVVDLRHMNGASVDPVARIATVGGGATMSNLDRATEPHGIATTGGRVSTTGVGGFTLGGGGGWLDRKFGLACDNLVSLELVTADGELVTASADENPELFWALHGGGGNFGVVTSMRLRLYPLTNVFAGLLLWPAEAGPHVLRTYRDFIAGAPDEVGGGAVFLTGPEADFTPPELVNRLTLAIIVFYAGPEAAGRAAFAPILGLAPSGQFVSEMPYADFQCMIDDPPGYRNYWSAEYLRALPDGAVDAFCEGSRDMIVPSPSQHVLFLGGGQAGRETADWPLPWRRAPWCFHPFGLWSDAADDDRARHWVRKSRQRLAQWATGDTYLNFIGDEGADRLVAGLGQGNFERLACVKQQYDPENIFRHNHNISLARAA